MESASGWGKPIKKSANPVNKTTPTQTQTQSQTPAPTTTTTNNATGISLKI